MREPTTHPGASGPEGRFVPYKGMESYQSEDADVFYGRERDAERLIARVLSHRFTLLHAPSGAGKTSLLNAKLLPGLEALDWWPVRMTPQQDPVEATRRGALAALLPPPEIERLALDRVLAECEPSTSLEALVQWYWDPKKLPIRQRRELGLTRAEDELAVTLPEGQRFELGRGMPFLARVLRRSITPETYGQVLEATAQGLGSQPAKLPELGPHSTLAELGEILDDPRLRQGHRALLAELAGPTPGLWAFFEDLHELFLYRLPHSSLVLIFDQFEELFTLFTDDEPGVHVGEGTPETSDAWRLRWEFLEELERLYRTPAPGPSGAMPRIRFLISMREEWVARLGPIRDFAPDLAFNAYYLDFLRRQDATAAITQPAEEFGGHFDPQCVKNILDDLELEARFVQPAHLQIVCSKLWRELEVSGRRRIDQRTLHSVGGEDGTQGILQGFLEDFLEVVPTLLSEKLAASQGPPETGSPAPDGELPTDLDVEALEMLDALFTSNGHRRTRRILPEDELVAAPLRSRRWRQPLLEVLIDQYIVRREKRVSGNFVEITHEFLLGAIDRAIQKRQRDLSSSLIDRRTLKDLERFGDSDFRSFGDSPIRADALRRLHHARDRFEWPDWACEVMLRSVLLALPELADKGPELVRHWSRRLDARPPASLEELFALSDQKFTRAPRRRTLSLEELHQIECAEAGSEEPAASDARSAEPALDLAENQIERILRSYLWMGGSADHPAIQSWTRRLRDHG